LPKLALAGLLLLLLGIAMSRPEPPLLQEEEDDHKNSDGDGDAGLENRKKKGYSMRRVVKTRVTTVARRRSR
jgi:hypothetical protein